MIQDLYSPANDPGKLIDMGKMGYKICNFLRQAKVSELNALEGTPIEATFSSMRLVEWRILEEVI